MTLGAIRSKLDAARRVQQSIKGLREHENWRQKLIVHRRELSVALSDLIEQNRVWIAPTELKAHHRALSNSLSALRSAIAFHQASWPAVSVDPDAPAYLETVGDLRVAFDNAERHLAVLEHADEASVPNKGD